MLTLWYSDGLADLKLTSQADSKRHISYGSNPVTRTIKLGHRLMIGKETVFRVTHINDFEYNSKFSGSDGLIKALVLSTSFIKEDDKENKVAYNNQNLIIEESNDVIDGDKEVSLGSTSTYSIGNGSSKNWYTLDFGNNKYELATIVKDTNGVCKIKITSDSRFVGKKFILKLHSVGKLEPVSSMEIKIVGL